MPQTDQYPNLIANYDGTYNSYWPNGDKPEPPEFVDGETITITSYGLGFSFGEKEQAAPIFFWSGRNLWENGEEKFDFADVTDGQVVPYGMGEAFGNNAASVPRDYIVFSDDTRQAFADAVSINIQNGAYFGRPRGYVRDTYWESAYFSWRFKGEDGSADFMSYPFSEINGEFISGESFECVGLNGTTYSSPGKIRHINHVNNTVQTTRGFNGLSEANRAGATLVGLTSGATAILTGPGYGQSISKPHRFDAEGVTSRYRNITGGSRFFSVVNDNGSEVRYFEGGAGGADSGYHDIKIATGEWELLECVTRLRDPLGYAYFAKNGIYRKYNNGIVTDTVNKSVLPNVITFGDDGSGGGGEVDVGCFVSELYFDKTVQRVFCSNAPTYRATGKNIELQLPIAWSSESITFRCIKGGLNLAEPVYLYIVNDKNEINGVDINSYQSQLDVSGILIGSGQ